MFKLIISKCGHASACPTIFDDQESGNFVVIGTHDQDVIKDPVVRQKIAEGKETAVVIPKELLMEYFQKTFTDFMKASQSTTQNKPVDQEKEAA